MNNKNQRKKAPASQGRKKAQKKKQSQKGVAKVEVPVNYSQKQNCVTSVQCDIDLTSLGATMIGLLSYLADRGLVNSGELRNDPTVYDSIYGGAAWLLYSMCTLLQGGTANVVKIPQCVAWLKDALKPKSVRFHEHGKVGYGWKNFDAATPNFSSFPSGNGIWRPTYVSVASGSYDAPATVWPYTLPNGPNSYSKFLSIIDDLADNPSLKLVPIDNRTTLANDASAFARIYSYNGLQLTTTSGVYIDYENEVTVHSPMYTKFCNYTLPDKRVPRPNGIGIFNGDPSWCTSWPLNDTFVSTFNKIVPSIKQIDYEEIYATLVLWMCRLKESAQNAPVPDEFKVSLPFSQQSFRVMLRQALLTVFKDQYVTQFNGYTKYDGDTNAFVPFLVMGHSYGAVDFETMQVPQLIAEMLASYVGRIIKLNKKSKFNVPTMLATLGRYYQDTPIIPMFNTVIDGVLTPIPLFQPDEAKSINLTDLSTGNTVNDYIQGNNGWYLGVKQDWNNHVTGLSCVSVPTCNIRLDGGPVGLGTLWNSRIVEKDERPTVEAPGRQYRVQAIRHVKNNGIRETGKKVTAIPPASLLNLSTVTATSATRLTSEMEAFLDLIILPTVRLNESEDALTLSMYQTQTGEMLWTPYSKDQQQVGASNFSRCNNLAGLCVTGIGKDVNNVYTEIMKKLSDLNKGGVLSGLLSGALAAVFPGSESFTKPLAAALPF